jgi:hypothetical protein
MELRWTIIRWKEIRKSKVNFFLCIDEIGFSLLLGRYCGMLKYYLVLCRLDYFFGIRANDSM